MISRIYAVAAVEFRIAFRNRLVLVASVLMTLFAIALTFAGAAPTGSLGVDLLTVSVASMTTLSVYLVPLLALMIAFDAIVGEVERGSLALLLTYPLTRAELLLGKYVAHMGTLAIAVSIGFGSAGLIVSLTGGAGADSLLALLRLTCTSILLGATFLAIGYAISSVSRSAASAAGFAAAVWLVFVVLYDLGLLAAVVYDSGGTFTRTVFPWLLALNPADAFRFWNVSGSEDVALTTGMTGATAALPGWAAPASLLLWPVLTFWLAHAALRRIEP